MIRHTARECQLRSLQSAERLDQSPQLAWLVSLQDLRLADMLFIAFPTHNIA